jgi:hypothetical protein
VCRKEGAHTEARVEVAVKHELCGRKPLLPVGLLLVNIVPEVRLHLLVQPFGASVCL